MTSPSSAGAARFPRQILFVIGNEAFERFSFYGMRNILATFLATVMLLDLPEEARQGAAKEVFHSFVIGVYFFPLLGGWLADRVLGKYRVILYLSLVYTLGHALLAVFEGWKVGFYGGLLLIALGSGGIKPCVSSFVGDQFDESNKDLAKFVFDAFYWIINFGSFFATLLAPMLLREYGPSVAFGVPGVLMLLATAVFWAGRDGYVRVPPTEADPHSFLRVCTSALRSHPVGWASGALAAGGVVLALALWPTLGAVPSLCLALVLVLGIGGAGTWFTLDGARAEHPPDAIDGVRSVLRLLVVFALVTPFWSLFDQKASTWLFQAGEMTKPAWFHPAQMQSLNPALVMLIIPLNNLVLFPAVRALGVAVTPLRRMTAGIALSGLSWVVVAAFQVAMDGGTELSIAWQVLPYVILTLGEVLVSATGLEFAYSQAPHRMKGTLMSFWSLCVTVGNLWVLLVDAGMRTGALDGVAAAVGVGRLAFQMGFFAMFAFAAAALFGMYAARYPVLDQYRKG